MTILVCDDDKEIVEAIEIYLMQEGYDVEKAYDGIQAVEIMKNKKIDLMIIAVSYTHLVASSSLLLRLLSEMRPL